MMKARTSLWASLAIAASIGLAGCGGSSDNGGGAVTTPATQPAGDPAPAVPVAIDPLPNAGDIHTQIEQDNLTNPNTIDSKSIEIDAGKHADYAGVRFMCPEGGDDCTVNFQLDLTTATATTGGDGIGTATAVLLSTAGTGTALRTLANEIRKEPNPTNTDLNENGMSLPSRLGFPSEGSGGSLKDPDDDGKDSTASKFQEDSSHAKAAMAPSGDHEWKGGPWSGKAWAGDDQVVVRFTNQKAAETTSFAEKYGFRSGNAADVTQTDFDGDAAAQRNALLALAKANPLPDRTGPQTVAPNDGTDGFRGIAATLDGVGGSLACSADCNLTNDEGSLSSTGGTWTFTADKADSAVPSGIEDADYLAFGWWRQDKETGAGFANFEPVWGGRDGFPTSGEAIRGKATYSGGATGNYTTDVGFTSEHGGWFIADAKLTAQFGQAGEESDPEKDNRITGTISNFRGAHGTLGEWEVKLGITDASTDGNLASGEANIESGETIVTGTAGNVSWTGDWDGDFYGENDGNKLPSGVAGWFHALTDGAVGTPGSDGYVAPSVSGVAVQGSFAATRQP